MKKILKANKNSWKHKIYVYCTIVFLLPVLVILGLNIQSMRVIKNQTVIQNQHMLEQMMQLMDSAVLEMKDVCLDIFGMEEISVYAIEVQKNPDNQVYRRYELAKNLELYKKEKIKDVFVYFPQDDYIISGGNGALRRREYCQIYYNDTAQMKEDFYNQTDHALGYPSLFVLDKNGDSPQLGVSIKYNLGKRWGNFVAVCILDEKYLKKYAFDFVTNNMGSGLIFGENKELILSKDKEKIDYDLSGFTQEAYSYEDSFNKEQYMMQVLESDVIDAYYAVATPTDIFWAQLLEMRVLSAASIVACVLAGVVLIMVFSKKLYEPLGTVVQMLKQQNKDAENVIEDVSEFFFLEKKFLELNEKRKDGEYALKEKKKRLQEEYLWNLMEGKNEYRGEAYIHFDSNYFVAGVIVIEDVKKEKDPIYHFVIDNVFEEIFNRTDHGYVLNLNNQKDFFILNLREASQSHLLKMLEEGKSFLEKSRLPISIGCSDIHEGLSELPIAYQEGLEALSYRFLHGKGSLLSYDITKGRDDSYLNEARVDVYNEISQYLNAGVIKVVPENYVPHLFEKFSIHSMSSFTAVECFKVDVVSAMNRLGIRYCCSIEERKETLSKLQGTETLEEFNELLSHKLAFLMEKKNTWERENAICLKVREYVNENYHDEQLNVARIGKHVGLSASYLSKLYKEAFGITIAYEISEVRMKHARELLVNTEVSIEEIAKQTGFSNISVFTKAFKKQVGIPPGKYRQENRIV